MRRTVIICLILAGVTLSLYWPANHFDLILFDDPLFVTVSPEINSGVTGHGLAWAFTTIVAANWHPVTNLTFLLTHQFWGANPGAEHLVNTLLHAANAVLLFLLLQNLTRAPWRSAMAAALFAWHPLRVESVAWIAERKDVLSGFFFLLTLWFYARHAAASKIQSSQSRLFYGLSLLAFALGLMSKAMLVTVPFVLLLLDVWPLKRWIWGSGAAAASLPAGARGVAPEVPVAKATRTGAVGRPADGATGATLLALLWEKWPFFLLTVVFCLLTYWVQQTHAAVSSLQHAGLDVRLGNVILSYLRYLGKTLWPADLAILYPFPVNQNSYLALWPGWEIGVAAAALLLFSGGCLGQIPRRPWLAVGWFWYVGTMLPVIGLIQVGGQGMADRYTYIPLIGPVMAAVWAAAEAFGSGQGRVYLASVGIVILGACGWATENQLSYWRSTVPLFAHTIQVTGDNFLAQMILGHGYENEGRFDDAGEHYQAAIGLCPLDKQGYQALAALEEKREQWEGAAANYGSAADIDPRDPGAQLGLATVLPHLGRNAEALEHLELAWRDNPESPDILNNLAWALATRPEKDRRDGARAVQLAEHACALTHYQKTIMIGTLAAAYAETERFDDAVIAARKACAQAAATGETDLLKRNQELLALYEKHQAWHEPAEKP